MRIKPTEISAPVAHGDSTTPEFRRPPPFEFDLSRLRYLHGPKTAKAIDPGTKKRSLLETLIGGAPEEKTKRSERLRREISQLSRDLSAGGDLTKLTRRYRSLASEAKDDPNLTYYLAQLEREIASLALARLPHEPERAVEMCAAYLETALADRSRLSSRIAELCRSKHTTPAFEALLEEALYTLLSQIDIADLNAVQEVLRLAERHQELALPPEWLRGALFGMSEGDLVRRTTAASYSRSEPIRNAALELVRAYLDAPGLTHTERARRIDLFGDRDPIGELRRRAFDRLRADSDLTIPEHLHALLPMARRMRAPISAEALLSAWTGAGLLRDRIEALALELEESAGPDTVSFILHRLDRERFGDDRLAFAKELRARAETLKNQHGARVHALRTGLGSLLREIGPDRPALCDLVVEAALKAGVPLPPDLRMFGSDPEEELARALSWCTCSHAPIAHQARTILAAALSPSRAPTFDVLRDRIVSVLDAIDRSPGGDLARSLVSSFERLCSLARTQEDDAELRRIFERLEKLAPTFQIPSEHLLRVFGGGDPPERVFARAVAQLGTTGDLATKRAREVVRIMLEDPALDATTLLFRLEQVMARIQSIADQAKARIKTMGFGRMQQAANDAKRNIGDLVWTVAANGFARLSQIGDWSDDRTALFLLLAPEPLEKEGIRALALAKDPPPDLFAGPRPLVRAAKLSHHSNPEIRKNALQALNAPPQDLYDALLAKHGPPKPRIANTEVSRLFTREAVKAAIEEDGLSPFELAERITLVTKEWLQQPSTRDPGIITEVIAPAYERLASIADFDDARLTQMLLELPVMLHGSEAERVTFGPHARRLFEGERIDEARALELLVHPDAAIRDEAARTIESRFDRAPEERSRIIRDVRAKIAAAKKSASKPSDASKAAWFSSVREGLDLVRSGPMQALFRMEARFVEALSQRRDTIAALRELDRTLPASLARNIAIDRIVGTPEWIDRSVLVEAARGYGSDVLPEGRAELLVRAIGSHIGDPSQLVECLEGRIAPAAIASEIGDDPKASTELLEELRAEWQAIDPALKPKLLERAFVDLFAASHRPEVVAELKQRGIGDPQEAFRDALKKHALDALASDPDARDLGDRIQKQFDELPERTKAKILTSLLLEPPTTDAPELVRRLAKATGVVAVKAAQQMCEDPDVPARFRSALEDLRDQNAGMSPVEVWRQIPAEAQRDIRALGKTLGTGSVKQALLVQLEDGREAIAAVVLADVPQQIADTIRALRILDDTRHLVDRIEPMLAREIDLLLEAKAFDALRETPVGKSPISLVPRVIRAHPRMLIRELAPGMPLSATLRERPLDEGEQTRLVEVHRLLVRSALDTEPHWLGSWVHRASGSGTFVLTDPHQGNLSDDGAHIGLFDPGQYENLSTKEAELFVRMLVAFSNERWQVKKRASLVDSLASLCRAAPGSPNIDIRSCLDRAYEETFREPNATVGRKLHLFLLAASKKGVAIPNGYFGLAKMLHSLQSQETELGLPDVVSSVIRDLYLDQQGPVGRIYRAVT